MSRETAEFAFDLHSGLSTVQVPEFDQLQIIGMAATLAIHIKGLGDIEYEVLRKVSDHFMSNSTLRVEIGARCFSGSRVHPNFQIW